MKRFFTLCTLVMCSLFTLFASEKPDNEAFYLVGDFNGWGTPDSGTSLMLTDEDNDGVYTGSFDIAAGSLNFKVFSKICGWGDSDGYFGYGQLFLFGNEPVNIPLYDSYYSNIEILNWEGGMIDVSIEWVEQPIEQPTGTEYVWRPKLTLSAPQQPHSPTVPEVYAIGNFNNWQLPESNNENGAVKLSQENQFYTGLERRVVAPFEPGVVQIALYVIDPVTHAPMILGIDSPNPFTLYACNDADGIVHRGYKETSGYPLDNVKPKDHAFTINDWKGGTMVIAYDYYYTNGSVIPQNFYVSADDTPLLQLPENLYLVVEEDRNQRIREVNTGYMFGAGIFEYIQGKQTKLTVTSEDSMTPDPANCWGIAETLEEAGLNASNPSVSLPLVKGGKPFSFDFPELGDMFVSLNLLNSEALVRVNFLDNTIHANKVYICGDVENIETGERNGFTAPSEYNREFYDKNFRLTETSEGIFEGTYLVYKRDPEYLDGIDRLSQFRFYTDLLGWSNEASLGSGFADFSCVAVNVANGSVTCPIIKNGLGNWGLSLDDEYNWEANTVHFVVNTKYQTVTLSLADNAVSEIEDDSINDEIWYNLQGIKVEHPSKGMFIHIENGKSKIEYVR